MASTTSCIARVCSTLVCAVSLAACGEPATGSTGPGRCTPDVSSLPELLSETGRFDDDTESYEPISPLWSDGADKRRFVRVPCAQVIDTSDAASWALPLGTTLWKDFHRDGVNLETRVAKKVGEGASDWELVAYQWDADQQDAVQVPEGAYDADQDWTVPDVATCLMCHANFESRILGFTAVQLGHEGSGLTVASLAAAGRLSDPPTRTTSGVEGWEPVARAAAAAMHASCGHCHGPGGLGFDATVTPTSPGLSLRLRFDDLAPADSDLYLTAVGVPMLTQLSAEIVDRVTPGDPLNSGLVQRMLARGDWTQMPPIATGLVDDESAAAVDTWITALAP